MLWLWACMAIVSCWPTRVDTVYVLFSLRSTLQTLHSSWLYGLRPWVSVLCPYRSAPNTFVFCCFPLGQCQHVAHWRKIAPPLAGLIILTSVIHWPSLTSWLAHRPCMWLFFPLIRPSTTGWASSRLTSTGSLISNRSLMQFWNVSAPCGLFRVGWACGNAMR